jgi:hypothetical protein
VNRSSLDFARNYRAEAQTQSLSDVRFNTEQLLNETRLLRAAIAEASAAEHRSTRWMIGLTVALAALTLVLVALTYVLVADGIGLWPFPSAG